VYSVKGSNDTTTKNTGGSATRGPNGRTPYTPNPYHQERRKYIANRIKLIQHRNYRTATSKIQ